MNLVGHRSEGLNKLIFMTYSDVLLHKVYVRSDVLDRDSQ